MRFAHWTTYDSWSVLPSVWFFNHGWGWSVQICFLCWGFDVAYDYQPHTESGE